MKSIVTKKYDMTMLYEFILLVAVITIVALLVFQLNNDARNDAIDSAIAKRGTTISCNKTSGNYYGCGITYNATINSDNAVAKIPSSLKLLGTAVVFGAILWVILRVIPMGRTSTSTFQ